MTGHMHAQAHWIYERTPRGRATDTDGRLFSLLALTQSADFNSITSGSGIAARVTSHPTLCNANALVGKK